MIRDLIFDAELLAMVQQRELTDEERRIILVQYALWCSLGGWS